MNKIDVRENPTVISDSASVISDSGRVRLGDLSPSFPLVRGRPDNVSDSRKVRIGDLSPSFPRLLSK